MGDTIKLNDGLKVYDIQNQHGEVIGQFKINPTDSTMVDRYKESLKKLEEISKQYSEKDDEIEVFIELQKKVIDELCYVVGNDSVKVFFDVMGAFSLQDGQYYYEKVLDIIGGLISKEGKKERQAMKQRIEKYAKRYK